MISVNNTMTTLSSLRKGARLSLMIAATLGAGLLPASADIILADNFDYTVGQSLAGANGGTGWSNAWNVNGTGASADIGDQAFSAPSGYGLSVSKYVAINATTASASINRGMSSSINLGSSNTYYFSLLFSRVDSDPSSSSETMTFLSLRNSSNQELIYFGTGSNESLALAAREAATGGSAVTANSVGSIFSTGTSFANAPQYLIIGKIVVNASGSDEFSMSIVAASDSVGATEPTTWDVSISADTTGIIESLYMGVATNAENANYTNLMIGTDYVSVIPEANSSGLVVLALLVLFGFRKSLRGRQG
ncbi:MAG: hypothetical protein Q7Q73_06405 [Verrucomicrobiota bacterium JB024]|nr:hypothetical protein [Verrucomicrobiota bacterium JB024]